MSSFRCWLQCSNIFIHLELRYGKIGSHEFPYLAVIIGRDTCSVTVTAPEFLDARREKCPMHAMAPSWEVCFRVVARTRESQIEYDIFSNRMQDI